MKTYRAVSYSRSTANRSTANRPVVVQTKPKAVDEKAIVGLHLPIDVNFDHPEKLPSREIFEDKKQFDGSVNADQNDKKNGKTLGVIALMTVFLFLLAGLLIKFTNNAGSNSFAALVGSVTKTSPDKNTPPAIADNALGSLSDILATRISLISSKNPKFIVTAKGEKIVPNDIIDGRLTVTDILVDHIVVTSNGANLKIAY